MKFTFYTDDVTKLSAACSASSCFEDQLGEGAIFKAVDGRLDGLADPPRRRRAVQGQEGPDAVAAHARPRRRRSACSSSVAARARTCSRPICAASPRASSRPAPPRRRPRSPRCCRTSRAAPAPRRPSAPRSSSPRARCSAPTSSIATSPATRRSPFTVEEVKIVATPDNVDGARLEALKRGVAARRAGRRRRRAGARPHQRARRRDDADEDGRGGARRSPSSTASRSRCSAPRSAQKLGMGMYLAVSQGSRRGAALHPPHLQARRARRRRRRRSRSSARA